MKVVSKIGYRRFCVFAIVALCLVFIFIGNHYNYPLPPCSSTEEGKSKNVNLLVLFTSLYYVKNREKVYNNTKRNWAKLGPGIQPVLFVKDEKIAKEFRAYGWDVYGLDRVTVEGKKPPVLKQMFLEIQQKYCSHFIGFTNADLLYTEGLYKTIEFLRYNYYESFTDQNIMMVGRRTNVDNISSITGSDFQDITKLAASRGKLQDPDGLDLFITNHNYPWSSLPELVIGRQKFDNWMVIRARKNGHVTMDLTNTVLALHQEIDNGTYIYRNDMVKYKTNLNLLNLLYSNISLRVGTTTCTPHFTSLGPTNKIELNIKHIPDYCFDYYGHLID